MRWIPLERRRAGAQPRMIIRIALANIEIPSSPADSVERVLRALPEAAKAGARVVCFPEAYVPGYPWGERRPANVDATFLDDAHAKIAKAAERLLDRSRSAVRRDRSAPGPFRASSRVANDVAFAVSLASASRRTRPALARTQSEK